MRRKFAKHEPWFAAKWMLAHLIGEEAADRINIDVYVRNMTHQLGQVKTFEWSNPKNFSLSFHSGMGRKASLKTIAHEIRHIEQFVSGRMKLIPKDKGAVMWCHKRVRTAEDGSDAYFDHPWEKEARATEEKLTNAYLRFLRKRKRMFANGELF